mmetsp:Transcript_11625/g.16091  ORF Transcript_11625/g.16091 Transcript_11625/m.16091 type:complete len:123 (-) Transcript_11625:350-718(-)
MATAGDVVGKPVGNGVGSGVGEPVLPGRTTGVGNSVGSGVGSAVVGDGVGNGVGRGVGSAVGASAGSKQVSVGQDGFSTVLKKPGSQFSIGGSIKPFPHKGSPAALAAPSPSKQAGRFENNP